MRMDQSFKGIGRIIKNMEKLCSYQKKGYLLILENYINAFLQMIESKENYSLILLMRVL